MTRSAALQRAGAGFSLVELAMVTLIIGIFLTLGLSAINATRESQALSTTNAKQAAIKEALIGYLRRNSRLPCPDTEPVALAAPDGIENRAVPGNPATACAAAFGTIPYVTLGISRDAAQDGWGNLFSYHVANTAGANTDWTLTASFRTGNTGVITVNDRAADGAAAAPIATAVVAVIVSHGSNGFGAYAIGGTRNALPAVGTDERDNTDANATYFRRSPTTDDAAWPIRGAFDDVVMFITADDLLSPLFNDGTFKPPTASIIETFAKLKSVIVGFAMATSAGRTGANCDNAGGANCRVIPFADSNANGTPNSPTIAGGLPWGGAFGGYSGLNIGQAITIDPWGVAIQYTIGSTALATIGTICACNGNGISSTLPTIATTLAFQLTSAGPDRTFATADDISLVVTVVELRGYLAGLLP